VVPGQWALQLIAATPVDSMIGFHSSHSFAASVRHTLNPTPPTLFMSLA
jgi:hypothetical protein